MAEQLDTSSNSGSQNTNSGQATNLQPTGQTSNGGTQSSRVQPGQVVGLQNAGQLNDDQLAKATLSVAPAVPADKPQQTGPEHANFALFGISGLLFVVAIALFWFTNRSAKNTT